LTENNLSIETKRTPQQDVKSNNIAQDDEHHNATLSRRNHEEKKQKKKLDKCGNHLFRLKERGKTMHMCDFRSKTT